MVTDIVADMATDMVTHMLADMLTDMVVDIEVDIVHWTKCIVFFIHGLREAPQKPPGKFGTIDPNVGEWGQVVPNFYKSMFLWYI